MQYYQIGESRQFCMIVRLWDSDHCIVPSHPASVHTFFSYPFPETNIASESTQNEFLFLFCRAPTQLQAIVKRWQRYSILVISIMMFMTLSLATSVLVALDNLDVPAMNAEDKLRVNPQENPNLPADLFVTGIVLLTFYVLLWYTWQPVDMCGTSCVGGRNARTGRRSASVSPMKQENTRTFSSFSQRGFLPEHRLYVH